MEKRVLRLPLKKEWYEMIESGTKTEEYREIAKYWISRCCENKSELPEDVIAGKAAIREYDEALFSFGYTTRTMTFEIKSVTVGVGKKEWGALDEPMFIIKLGKRLDNSDVEEEDNSVQTEEAEVTLETVEEVSEKLIGPELVSVHPLPVHNVVKKPVRVTDTIDNLIDKYKRSRNWVTTSQPQVKIDTYGKVSGSNVRINYYPEYPLTVTPLEYTISWNKSDTEETFYQKVDDFLKRKSRGLYTIVICNNDVKYVPGKYLKINLSTIRTDDKTKGLF